MKRNSITLISLLSAVAMLLAACSGGGAQATATLATGGGVGVPTQAPAGGATMAATAAASSVPSTGATGAATSAATGAATSAATAASTSAATTAATSAPSGAATVNPTAAAVAANVNVDASKIDCVGAKQGDTASMLYQWSGVEEANIMAILKPLVDKCGIVLKPESTRDQGLLDTRVKAGTPPDIAFWNVPQLQQYAKQLIAVDTLIGSNASNYIDSWKKQGTVDGKWVGLPVKTDIKTIVWYSPTNFQALGYTVPKSFSDLSSLADKMAAANQVPWAMGVESGGATGWPAADFIEDILLVQKGPDYVNGLIDGSVPFNDPGVKAAFEQYGKWAMDPKYAVGGAKGTLSTNFNKAALQPFSDPPEAMMDRISGFAGGVIAAQYPNLKYGSDYAFFPLPEAKGMQIGADWMMAFKDSPAVKAIFNYLASPAGAQAWAQVGFDMTPNSAGKGQYKIQLEQDKADALYSAAATVPSIGDIIPGGFGTAEWKGIVDYINGGNLDNILSTLAQAQKSALGK